MHNDYIVFKTIIKIKIVGSYKNLYRNENVNDLS